MEVRFTISKSFIYCAVVAMFLILIALCLRLAVRNAELTRTVYEQQERIIELEDSTSTTRQYKPVTRDVRYVLQRMN